MSENQHGFRPGSNGSSASFSDGALPYRYWVVEGEASRSVEGGVIEETTVSIHVNGRELATLMCSPLDEEALALGFLFNEGVIQSLDDVGIVRANVARTLVDVLLRTSDFSPPRRMILTAGCGTGITFRLLTEQYPALDSDFVTTPEVLQARMREMQGHARLYQQVRGVHTSALADENSILICAEDVGRHNTIDKIAGKALQTGTPTADRILISSGRISSEMITKARRMDIPIVVSRTAPTSTSLRLAMAWGICLVGYVRRGGMRVYTAPHRLGLTLPAPST
ncbi:MAG: formate dehydrogenase accessory sulfurtransferase FdhD [Anaerolineae bacterium]|nr:formate dehydrogenase accessory sulfurtransferase FdhD [Anaerolineae bacterium]